MATREQIIQWYVREYIEETGDVGVERRAYAEWLMKKGVRPPPAPTEQDLMARAVKSALKNEIRNDEETGLPYHAWQCVPLGRDRRTGQMSFVFVDTDKATREEMEKSIVMRVGGMVDDGVRLTYDIEHWNRVNRSELPLDVKENLDLRDQVEWRRNAAIDIPTSEDVDLDLAADADDAADADADDRVADDAVADAADDSDADDPSGPPQ
jgi:hypothetical protein